MMPRLPSPSLPDAEPGPTTATDEYEGRTYTIRCTISVVGDAASMVILGADKPAAVKASDMLVSSVDAEDDCAVVLSACVMAVARSAGLMESLPLLLLDVLLM